MLPPSAKGRNTALALLNAGGEVLSEHCFVPNFRNGDGANMTTLASFGFPLLWNPATARYRAAQRRDGAGGPAMSAQTRPVVNQTRQTAGRSLGANANMLRSAGLPAMPIRNSADL